jgi:RND family efflux transporter MFP subunit
MKLPKLSLAALLLLLAACSHQTGETAASATKPVEAPAVDVITRAAEESFMPRFLRVTGELNGYQKSHVAADASGKVVAAPIERGSIVSKGDLLIKLDDRNAALSLLEAEANVVAAKAKVDLQTSEVRRNEPLARTNAIADAEYQKLKADLAAAEASLAGSAARRDMARKSLADTSILAPFSGTVAERLTEVGEYVASNTQVANLVAIDRLRLTLYVPETAVGKIREGQQVSFNVPAFPDEAFTGVIKFIGASVRESARDLIIEAEVANQDGRLKPGMFAEGRIALEEVQSVIVPATALKTEGSIRKVFVVRDGKIEERLVEVGESKGDTVEIRRGISKGEPVVVTPTPETADGLKVKLTAQL